MDKGIDYAWTHPAPKDIAAAGYKFAVRYLSNDPTKNITPTEAAALAAYGISIVLNWEFRAQDMLRGYSGGVADARYALVLAQSLDCPAGRPIYFSADWDVTPAQENAVIAYLHGAQDALTAHPAGLYGGFYPDKTALDMSATKWAWQTTAWSGGQWDGREKLRQIGTDTISGVEVDVNQAMAADYGQWLYHEGDTLITPEDVAAITASVTQSVHDSILNHQLGEVDLTGKLTGSTITLGMAAARSRAVEAELANKPSVTVDAAQLAAELAAQPGFLGKLASEVAAKFPASYTVTPAPVPAGV